MPSELELITAMLEVKPEDPQLHYRLAQVLLKSGDVTAAEASYFHSINLNPEYSEAYFSLALLEFSRQNSELAFHYLDKISTIKEVRDTLLLPIARIFIHSQQLTKALDFLRRLIELNKPLVEPYRLMGRILMYLNQWDSALICFQEGLELVRLAGESIIDSDEVHLLIKDMQICQDSTLVNHKISLLKPERQREYLKGVFKRCIDFLKGNHIEGLILEFGTYMGSTARMLTELCVEKNYSSSLYLYDSFQGFPSLESEVDHLEVEITPGWLPGQMKLPPDIEKRIRASLQTIAPHLPIKVIKGFFKDTLSEELPNGKASLVHIDCDLYRSTLSVLKAIFNQGLLQDGTLLVFDDYNCNSAMPSLGERRALSEFLSEQKRFTVSLLFSYGWHGQVFIVHDMDLF